MLVCVCVSKARPAGGGFFVAALRRPPQPAGVSEAEFREPVPLPITDELDLHTFRPDEVTPLLEDYFVECRRRGIRQIRVVHGKGIGTLQATVHAHLRQSAQVAAFALGDEKSGGWGATWVTLNLPR